MAKFLTKNGFLALRYVKRYCLNFIREISSLGVSSVLAGIADYVRVRICNFLWY